jgi:hypothetical protein
LDEEGRRADSEHFASTSSFRLPQFGTSKVCFQVRDEDESLFCISKGHDNFSLQCVPKLVQPSTLLDNLSSSNASWRKAGIFASISRYIPLYSPELNPIEEFLFAGV